MNDLAEVRRFEAELDAALMNCPLIAVGSAESILDCVAMINMAFSQDEQYPLGSAMADGLPIAVSALIARPGPAPALPVEDIARDLIFLGRYFLMRELLYYTYNAPDSLRWDFAGDRVRIAFRDPSLRREFALRHNTAIVARTDFAAEAARITGELRALLAGKPELGEGEHLDRAFEECLIEAEHRLSLSFDMLGGESSSIEFPNYSYADLYCVYRYLLAKAFFHRHYAVINDLVPLFRFDAEALVVEIETGTGVAASTVTAILADMTYSVATAALQPMHFSLVEFRASGEYLMIPEIFVHSDGITKVLRVYGLRDPRWFSATVSEPLGRAFTQTVAADFAAAGFHVRTNVELDKVVPGAPDIDVLAISAEATLGYYVFLCETKGFLPGFWAKDYLRATDKSVIPKAFEQQDRIKEVLATAAGGEFVADLVTRGAPRLVEEGLICCRQMVVTSQNSGMFFNDQSDRLIDYQTLRLLLRRCDGDVVYLLECMSRLPELFGVDEAVIVAAEIGRRTVQFEAQGFTENSVVNFAWNTWKTGGLDVEVAEEFFAAGGSPFDVLDRGVAVEGSTD